MKKKLFIYLFLGLIGILFSGNSVQANQLSSNKTIESFVNRQPNLTRQISCEKVDDYVNLVGQVLKNMKIGNYNTDFNQQIVEIFTNLLKEHLNKILNCRIQPEVIEPEIIEPEEHNTTREIVRCIFNNPTPSLEIWNQETKKPIINRCYTENSFGTRYCEGQKACAIKIIGTTGERLERKSSCGSNTYTRVNGQNKRIDFYCNTTEPIVPEPKPCAIVDCAEGYYPKYYGRDRNNCPIYRCEGQTINEESYRGVLYQCKNGEQIKLKDSTSCKPYSTRKNYVNDFCKNNGGVNNFRPIDQCGIIPSPQPIPIPVPQPNEESYRGVIYQCKTGEKVELRNQTSCKPYSTRKNYVNDFCRSNGGVNNFETLDQCR